MIRTISLALLTLVVGFPVAAQDSPWTYRAPPEPVELRYTSSAGDGAALVLSCVKDSRQVIAQFPVSRRLAATFVDGRWRDDVGRPAPWPVSVTIASADAQTTIPGLADIDPAGGGSIVTVEFADRAPVAEAFRMTGELRLSALGGGVAPVLAPRRSVQGFLRYCR